MKKKVICYHPELLPTRWNQSKPEPWKGETDENGNWCCPICGWGEGGWCYIKKNWDEEKETIFEEYDMLWRGLAGN